MKKEIKEKIIERKILSVCCYAPTKMMNDGYNGYGLYCLKCKLPTMGLQDFCGKLNKKLKEVK